MVKFYRLDPCHARSIHLALGISQRAIDVNGTARIFNYLYREPFSLPVKC